MMFGLFKKKGKILEIFKKNRLIIEGGFQDDWGTFYTDFKKYHIPKEINRLFLADSYKLDLMGILNSTGDLEPVEKTPETKQLELDYPKNPLIHSGIERTTTIIVDDGRVYHDKELLNPPEGSNTKRLSSFLTFLKNEGGFEKFYRKYEE